MKHRIAGRKLGRNSGHRKALLRNLSMDLIEKERIKTTLAKAKEVRRVAEKLVTLSKKETLHARRLALAALPNRRGQRAVDKLFESLSARFAQRPGGYTRILKLGPRRGDNAEMALLEFVAAEAPAAAATAGTEQAAAAGSQRPGRRKAPAKAPTKKEGSPREGGRKAVPGGRGGGGGTAPVRDVPRKKTSRKKAPAKSG
jgi:large subunit ribosomal protein L17